MNLQVAWNKTTKVATVQAQGDALPAGSINAGTFVHDDAADHAGLGHSHVLYQHVQDALYKQGQLDMQVVRINQDLDFVALVSIAIAPAGTSTLTVVAPTVQLSITKTPSNASNGAVTYVSSAPGVATVSPTGLVTRVSNGAAVITATSLDGAKTATKAITTTA